MVWIDMPAGIPVIPLMKMVKNSWRLLFWAITTGSITIFTLRFWYSKYTLRTDSCLVLAFWCSLMRSSSSTMVRT